jgi:hypothetical protein
MVKKKRASKYAQAPVVTTKNEAVKAAFYKATDEESLLAPGQIMAGTIQHPDTGLYQVWLSTNGYDFTQITAFNNQAKAQEAVEIIEKERDAGNLANQQIVDALFAFLAGNCDAEPRTLPDATVRELVREIRHRVAQGETK